MNSLIEILNHWGGIFLNFAWPMLWQSSLLILALFAFEYLFQRKVRASIRYTLWLVVLVKLCVPPTFALPTSPAWWLHKTSPPIVAKPAPHYTVTYDNGPLPETPLVPLPAYVPPKPTMAPAAWLLMASAAVSLFLLGWLLVRWWQITRQIQCAKTSERLVALAGEAQTFAGTKFNVEVKLTKNPMSPAVCGLFRPMILIPQSLVENFSDEQLRAVLLHELIHLRRRDVWVNFVQALLQIFYWWHPLVWLANAHIRRVREEAVDDAVMLALRDDAESYAPTLLEVAKLALNRPLASLGLVGILESRHALRQRIERLVDFHPPRKAGLTLFSLLGILAFTAVAVPMGSAPDSIDKQNLSASAALATTSITQNTNPPSVLIQADVYRMRPVDFEKINSDLKSNQTKEDGAGYFKRITAYLKSSEFRPISRPRILTSSGVPAQFYVGNETNSIEFDCRPFVTNGLIKLISHFQTILTSATTTTTNQSDNEFTLKNHGGIVIRKKSPDGSTESNLLVVTIGVEIVTNTSARYGQRLNSIVKQADVTNDPSESSNQMAMNFKLKHPIPQDELKKKLLATGVKIPPTVFFYHGNGLFLVRGSEEQLALVNRLMLQLNGYSPEEIEASDKQFPEQIRGIGFTGNSDTNLFSRHFRVGSAAFNSTLRNTPGLQTNNFSIMVKSFFSILGVDWESPKGKAIFYNDRVGELFVRATLTDFDIVERALVVIESADTNNQTLPGNRESLDRTGLHVADQTNFLIPTNDINKKMVAGSLVQDARTDYEMGKLDDAEKLLKSALSLDAENNAAKYYLGLVQAARQHSTTGLTKIGRQIITGKLDHLQLDPFGPFMGVSLAEVVRQLNEMARQNDPEKTGVNIVILTNSLPGQPSAIDSVVINLPSPLMNVKLGDALEAIVQNASTPLKYSIMDGSIIFSMGDGSDIPMLYSRHFRLDANKFLAAKQNVPGIKTNSVWAMARDFFKTLGVDLDVPGKSVFYGHRLSDLFVTATKQDLDAIQSAMEPFMLVAPQVHIKARFLEVPKEMLSLLRPFPELTNGVTILPAASFRKLMQTLESNPGTETLAEPEVVTTSGRQTQMRATVIQTIITNYAFHATGTNSAIYPQSDQVETGPVLDMIPYALSDDHTINLTLIASHKVFLGYDQPPTNAVGKYIKEYDITLPVILPSFRIQQASAQVNLWDGQTVVFGKPQQHFFDGDKEVGAEPDYFVKTKKSRGQPDEVDKELLVFITVTLVDPAGNRIHDDEDLPSAKDNIPSQSK